MFKYLLDLAEKDSKKKYSINKVKSHISSCEKRIQKSNDKIELAVKIEKEKKEKQELLYQEQEKKKLLLQQELEAKRLEEEMKKMKEEEILREVERFFNFTIFAIFTLFTPFFFF